MAEIGSGNCSDYPGTKDLDATPESTSTLARHNVPNDLAACILAIEAELGTDPAGNKTDLKTRLAVLMDDDGKLKNAGIADSTITYAKLATAPAVCRIKTGNYTGDGTTSQAITGIGFQPKHVKILKHAVGLTAEEIFERSDQDAAGLCWYHVAAAGHNAGYDDSIIAFGADGFTVDDNAVDADPNTNAAVYDYMCLG